MYRGTLPLLGVFAAAGQRAWAAGDLAARLTREKQRVKPLPPVERATVVTEAEPRWTLRTFASAREDGEDVLVTFGGDDYRVRSLAATTTADWLGRRLRRPVSTGLTLEEAVRESAAFTWETAAVDVDGDPACPPGAVRDVLEGRVRAVGPCPTPHDEALRVLKAIAALATREDWALDPGLWAEGVTAGFAGVDALTVGAVLRRAVLGVNALAAVTAMAALGVFKDVGGLECLARLKPGDPRVAAAAEAPGLTGRLAALYWHAPGPKAVVRELTAMGFDEVEAAEVAWTAGAKDVLEAEAEGNLAVRRAILRAARRPPLGERGSVHDLKRLLTAAAEVRRLVTGEPAEGVFFNLCARPYYPAQLTVDDAVLLAAAPEGADLKAVKERLIDLLLESEVYPSAEQVAGYYAPAAAMGPEEFMRRGEGLEETKEAVFRRAPGENNRLASVAPHGVTAARGATGRQRGR